MTPREALREMHYCIICHPRDKDSCSKGLREPGGAVKKNPLGIELTGCPLKEKISEAHLLKREGHGIGALAMIMVDNPLCAGTGHRICNDCMKSCIYQKQTPVNIPQIETSILSDVLRLPYGFEIYSLLTRWNPLNLRRPVPLPYNGKNILVVGMGPAGYTLAHYLLNEGFGVVGIDGLRIEPLSVRVRGAKRRVPQPIKDIKDITGPLDRRTILGFGGVSEYGITVRWDKNFLDINYLLMMRRKKFRLYDGIRFGGTLTLDDAWNLGFDHVAICAGAGKPTLVPMKNNLLRGVRLASDFLMGLQATGAYKANSLANLQLRLPAVVIGGGLTAIDTATEMQAYYVVQVEKALDRYDRLWCENRRGSDLGQAGRGRTRDRRDVAEARSGHSRGALCRGRRWTRAGLQSPGPGLGRRHHRRIASACRIRPRIASTTKKSSSRSKRAFALPNASTRWSAFRMPTVRWPRCAANIRCSKDGRWKSSGEFVTLPAARRDDRRRHASQHHLRSRTSGHVPARRSRRVLSRLQAPEQTDGTKQLVPAGRSEIGFFTSYEKQGRYVTFFGDNHPHYAGNVVKAMASAKDGHPEIAACLRRTTSLSRNPRSSRSANATGSCSPNRWTNSSSPRWSMPSA